MDFLSWIGRCFGQFLHGLIPIRITNQPINQPTRMGLGMLSLKHLATRAVLINDLDTSELPLSLHREMQQYRKLRGAFRILSMDLEVERIDGGEIHPDEIRLAFRCLRLSCAGFAIRRCNMPITLHKVGQNKWTIARADRRLMTAPMAAGAKRDVTLQLPEPSQLVNGIRLAKTEHHNSYTAQYFINGKIHSTEKKVRTELNNGREEVEEVNEDDLELEWSYWEEDWFWLTWVQRCEKPLRGLVITITTRATRAKGRSTTPVILANPHLPVF